MTRPNGQEHPGVSLRARGYGACTGCGERFALKTGTLAAVVRAGHVGFILDAVCPSCAKGATPLVVASPRAAVQQAIVPFAVHLRHLAKLYERSTQADGRHVGLLQAADILESGRLDTLADPLMPKVRAPSPPAPLEARLSPRTHVRKDPAPAGELAGELGDYERRLLGVLAARHPDATSRTQLAVLARVSRRSSTFSGALRTLRARGELAGSKDALRPTTAGLAAFGPLPPAFPKGEAVISAWVEHVGEYAGALLEIATTVYPDELPRAELAERAGVSPTSSTFSGALRELRALGLLEGLRASDSLMAVARRKD